MLVVPNASPYHMDKENDRIARMGERATAAGLPLIYAHAVGGQDEVVFDGASFAVNADGGLAAMASTVEAGDYTGPGQQSGTARMFEELRSTR